MPRRPLALMHGDDFEAQRCNLTSRWVDPADAKICSPAMVVDLESQHRNTVQLRMGDVESGQSAMPGAHSPSVGYPWLADLISRDPDSETYVFRRFNRLSARTLLLQQAELISLENRLDELDRQLVQNGEPDVQLAVRSWHEAEKIQSRLPAVKAHMELTSKIEKKLEAYRE